MKEGANTICFVAHNNIPVGSTVTYSCIVVYVRPQKEEIVLVQLTVVGNIIEYTGKETTKMADITTFKININSVISKQGSRYY